MINTPWYEGFITRKGEKTIFGTDIDGNKGYPIFIMDSASTEEHIQHMINCVNSHDELVKSLKLAINTLNQIPNTKNHEYGTTYKLIPVLEKALIKAESEK